MENKLLVLAVCTVFIFFFLLNVAGENSRVDTVVEEFLVKLKREDLRENASV
ncbi:hypothetical protein [Vibrio nereis]|uniref:hypothetical protein n=1 Tax=Vibrio nereis TaxID=693 RepID=UPI002494C17F|nr:hypothetical protein [Vibrio nereis]